MNLAMGFGRGGLARKMLRWLITPEKLAEREKKARDDDDVVDCGSCCQPLKTNGRVDGIKINPSLNQSTKLPINQSINHSINQPANQSIHQSIHPSINPSINLSINPSINPSINQSITGGCSWSHEDPGFLSPRPSLE